MTSRYILAAVVVVLVIAIIAMFTMKSPTESYRSCRDCAGYYSISPSEAPIAINPFVWPYSAFPCTKDIFTMPRDQWSKFGVGANPLTSPNTPDHAIQTT